jgi:hypothetical protein
MTAKVSLVIFSRSLISGKTLFKRLAQFFMSYYVHFLIGFDNYYFIDFYDAVNNIILD